MTTSSETADKPVIRVENVTKTFPPSLQSVSLRHEAQKFVRGLLSREESAITQKREGFTALRDINFEVCPGEALGLVGRNGSGKTTLIRLMANVMRPTTGNIEVNGRFAALIGLGTGFLPMMSGRENVYLNAAIYGVHPDETDDLFDDIAAFADIGEFMDQPVKNYSSGMRARLGFSVAVHILPDIVFIDEALSVGDSAFKQKCNAKIKSLLEENRTLVLVSHSNGSIRSLCNRVIWLHQGEMMMDGTTQEVLKAYGKFMKT